MAVLAGGALILNELAATRAGPARRTFPGRAGDALRRSSDRRSSRSRSRPERRADEPALLSAR